MRKKLFYLSLFCFLFFSASMFGQKLTVTGFVKDDSSNAGLSFANIRIDHSGLGTAANVLGEYKIHLNPGNYTFIASYLGYKSDTVKINLKQNEQINFKLSPVSLNLNEVTVTPDRNPAYDIIDKTIKEKEKIKNRITDYEYSAYTKGLIKTTQDFNSGGFSLSTQDTGKLKITGILENESRGFYKAPDEHKNFIVARKQTANTPPFINIVTGGNLIQSFYEDKLLFMGKLIPSPISKQALKYYYFYIEKELALDNKKVYQIYFAVDNTADPGFYGSLFIEDSTFYLLKVDVKLNRMANPGGLFNNVSVLQQFSEILKGIVLPVDYRIFAEGNYLGLAKFGFEFHTIMNDYEINTKIDNDVFDNAAITVLPDADKKSSNYWNSIQTIPNTQEEKIAYSRIDSLTKAENALGNDFNFLSQRIKLNKYFSVNGPLTFYSFNKVEGSALNLDLYFSDAENQRLNGFGEVSYGFSDKKFKKILYGEYALGDYRTTTFSLNAYDKISDMFSVSDHYNKFTSTILSLFTKYDFRDYFYTKGFELNINSEVLPILDLGIGYVNRTDKTAKNNTNFAFFYKNRNYRINRSIYETRTNAVTASFKVDFRKYIEDGFFRRRIPKRSYIIFEGSTLISNKSFLKSLGEFSVNQFDAYGSFPTADNWKLDFYAAKIFSTGAVPFQLLHALPGNISASGKNNSFRTLQVGEVVGDKVTELFLNHNFGDDLFTLLNIPFIRDLQLQFNLYLNIAMSDVTQKSKTILGDDPIIFKKPFYELGFSIGHLLIPLTFEFTWKLNYTGRNNFVFGINTIAL